MGTIDIDDWIDRNPGATTLNIVVILGDDIGLEQFSLHGQGSDYPAMPNLVDMADNGVRFNRFYVVPSCSGSRACLHTGRYSDRNGIGEPLELAESGEVPELYYSEVTFADFLKLVGAPHKTALIGKDHIFTGLNNSTEFDGPGKQGFDHWVGQVRNIPANVMDGRGYYDWDKRTRRGEFVSNVYNTTDITNEAIAWIRERRQLGEPYVLYVNYQACHNPMDPDRSQPPTDLYDTGTWGDPPPGQWENMKATLEAMDAEIGRLFTHIDLTQTTVFFLSDNGQESQRLPNETHPTKGPYPLQSGKRTMFDPGMRSPLYVRGPAIELPGRTATGLWFIADMYQTMGELLGYDPAAWLSDTAYPRRPKRVLDSISFKHVLDNESGQRRTSIVQALFAPNGVNVMDSPGQRAVIYSTGSALYKLIVLPSYADQSAGRLFYNLSALDTANEFEVGGTELLGGGSDPSVLNAADRAVYDACQQAMADLVESITENDLQFLPTTETFP